MRLRRSSYKFRRPHMLRESGTCTLFEIEALGRSGVHETAMLGYDFIHEEASISPCSFEYNGPSNDSSNYRDDPVDQLRDAIDQGYAAWAVVPGDSRGHSDYFLETLEDIEEYGHDIDAILTINKKYLRDFDPEEQALKINDYADGRGMYYIKCYEEVPLEDLESGDWYKNINRFDTYNVYDDRYEYIPSDVKNTPANICRNIDFSSFIMGGDQYVVFTGDKNIYTTAGKKANF